MNPNAPYIIARILGPLSVVAGAAMFSQTGRMMSLIDMLIINNSLMLMAGFLSLLSGLLILTFAHSWRGITEIIVTLMGWAGVVRGLLIVFLPTVIEAAGGFIIHNPVILTVAGGVTALVGLWLCFQGYFTTHVPEHQQLVDTLR